jgi:transcriptional regulator with GAF, ATPase, and Fis domain
MATLNQVRAGETVKSHRLFKKVTSVGSSSDCDIQLPDSAVAPLHCHIHCDGRLFELNASDRARIEVNGKRRKRHELCHGDRVVLGSSELVFWLHDDSGVALEAEPRDTAAISDYRTILEFSAKLLERYELPELLETLMDSVIAVSQAAKGFLVLFEEEVPRVRVARNLRRENVDDAVEQLSDSIVSKVVQTRQPLIVSDALNDDEFANSKSVINLNLVSVICVPLLDQDSLLGLLYVGNDNAVQLFDRRTLESLTVFAAQAALIVKNAILFDQLRLDNISLNQRLEAIRFGQIIGACDAMRDVFRAVEKVATTDVSVLISGDTGTGKELVATEIHRRSSRAKGPFVTINCGAIPENLLESELFGHVKGAFTGAVANKRGKFLAADGGTLFLDEIGELPLQLQVKLLRALQEKTVTRVGSTRVEAVDIRVLAATNKHLPDEIAAGNFREDLYYRINVVPITLPPLRQRGDDVTVIARYLLNRYATEYGTKVRGFSPNALVALKKHDWPGNIRQLENHIKKAVIMAEKPLLSPADLDLSPEKLPPIRSLAEAKEDFQRRYINEVLARNNGNRTKTARDLGVDPRTIFRHLEKEDELRS